MARKALSASSGEQPTKQQLEVYLAGLAQCGGHDYAVRWAEIKEPEAFLEWLKNGDSGDKSLKELREKIFQVEIDLERRLLQVIREQALNGDVGAAEYLLSQIHVSRYERDF